MTFFVFLEFLKLNFCQTKASFNYLYYLLISINTISFPTYHWDRSKRQSSQRFTLLHLLRLIKPSSKISCTSVITSSSTSSLATLATLAVHCIHWLPVVLYRRTSVISIVAVVSSFIETDWRMVFGSFHWNMELIFFISVLSAISILSVISILDTS